MTSTKQYDLIYILCDWVWVKLTDFALKTVYANRIHRSISFDSIRLKLSALNSTLCIFYFIPWFRFCFCIFQCVAFIPFSYISALVGCACVMVIHSTQSLTNQFIKVKDESWFLMGSDCSCCTNLQFKITKYRWKWWRVRSCVIACLLDFLVYFTNCFLFSAIAAVAASLCWFSLIACLVYIYIAYADVSFSRYLKYIIISCLSHCVCVCVLVRLDDI